MIVMFGIGVSRLFGLVREQVIAYFFGRAATYSAFVAAYKLPNLVRVLLGEGNLSASLIPVLAERMRAADPGEARRLAQSVLGLLLLTVGLITLAGVVAAPALAWLVAPGFGPELRALVERLIRILFPTVAFLVAGAWCMGILHVNGRFFWPNFAPLFWSVVSAGALIGFVGRVEMEPIYILAWGVVAGSCVQLLVQLPATRSVLGTLRPRKDWREPAVQRVMALFAPMMIGTGVAQLSTLIDIQIASFLTGAGVATLAYAQRLYLLPLSLFGVAIAQVALPTLAHDSVGQSIDVVRSELASSWRRMIFLMLPASVGLIAFGRPVVSLVFERGRFVADDTNAVTWVLAAYAAGLVAYGSVRLFATAFYACQDTRTPVRVAVGALVLNAVLGIGLAWTIGLPGIGLATALAAIANAVTLGVLLRRSWGRLFDPQTWHVATRVLIAAIIAGLAGVLPYLSIMNRWSAWDLRERIGASLALYVGIAVAYFVVAAILRVDELHRLFRRRS
ncbi:MAG: murein biosynthesis integral membrane protein MurJ [Gemmatimonadota bacterium]